MPLILPEYTIAVTNTLSFLMLQMDYETEGYEFSTQLIFCQYHVHINRCVR